MKYLFKLSILLIPCFFLLQSCASNSVENEFNNDEPKNSISIAIFIENQDLPKSQPYKISFKNEAESLIIFNVYFGEPYDCPSGCSYNSGIGLQYKGKIGWLSLDNSNEIDQSKISFYDISKSETYLYSENLWNDLNSTVPLIYHYTFLEVLVRDVDTPTEALYRIAQGLYSFINPYLGELLLLNTSVKSDRSILELLSNLPMFQGDAYYDIRQKAKEMLNNL